MRLLAFTLATLFATVLLTLFALEDPGYVLLARAPWSVEMSLTLFVVLLLLGFFLVYAVLFLLYRLVRIPRDVRRFRLKRQQRQARTALLKGLTLLAEGQWVEAETQLLAGLRHSDAPLLNCLGAAYAAEGQGNGEKRDEYLAQAHRHAPQAQLAIGISQSYLQQQARQSELALATLSDLRVSHPRHRYLLKLLAQVCLELRDWPGLVDLIDDLRQTQALETSEIDALELQAHRELLMLSLPSGSLEVLQRAWSAVPRHLKAHPLLVTLYARQLIQQGEMNEAEQLLRHTLEAAWDDRLMELYGEVRLDDATESLVNAESWLATHDDSARALLATARLAAAAGHPAKARGYYEKCVALRGPAEAYRELGALLEETGETQLAIDCYRRGLETLAEQRPGDSRARIIPLARRTLR